MVVCLQLTGLLWLQETVVWLKEMERNLSPPSWEQKVPLQMEIRDTLSPVQFRVTSQESLLDQLETTVRVGATTGAVKTHRDTFRHVSAHAEHTCEVMKRWRCHQSSGTHPHSSEHQLGSYIKYTQYYSWHWILKRVQRPNIKCIFHSVLLHTCG